VRHENAEKFQGPLTTLERPTAPIAPNPRLALIALAGLILTLLLLAVRPVFADSVPPEDPLAGIDVSAPPPARADFDAEPTPAETYAELVIHVESAPATPDLEALLSLRDLGWGVRNRDRTDELLAIAVANGNNPDLEPRNPFRKRKSDIFQTRRPITIGKSEMELRLRLRAKRSEAMSVELHF
jgi:hypothetical protein